MPATFNFHVSSVKIRNIKWDDVENCENVIQFLEFLTVANRLDDWKTRNASVAPQFGYIIFDNEISQGRYILQTERQFMALKSAHERGLASTHNIRISVFWQFSMSIMVTKFVKTKKVIERLTPPTLYSSDCGFDQSFIEFCRSTLEINEHKNTDLRPSLGYSVPSTDTFPFLESGIVEHQYAYVHYVHSRNYSNITINVIRSQFTSGLGTARNFNQLSKNEAVARQIDAFKQKYHSVPTFKELFDGQVNNVVNELNSRINCFEVDTGYLESNRRRLTESFLYAASNLVHKTIAHEFNFRSEVQRVGNGPFDSVIGSNVVIAYARDPRDLLELMARPEEHQAALNCIVETIIEAKTETVFVESGGRLLAECLDVLHTPTATGRRTEVRGAISTGHHNFFFSVHSTDDIHHELSYYGAFSCDIMPRRIGRDSGRPLVAETTPSGTKKEYLEPLNVGKVAELLFAYVAFMA